MFDEVGCEQKVYALVLQHVNEAFAQGIERDKNIKAGIKIQSQVIKILNRVVEEIVTQISYGLAFLQRLPLEIFKYGDHLCEKIGLDEFSDIFICKNCKRCFTHNYKKNGNDILKSASELEKTLCSGAITFSGKFSSIDCKH